MPCKNPMPWFMDGLSTWLVNPALAAPWAVSTWSTELLCRMKSSSNCEAPIALAVRVLQRTCKVGESPARIAKFYFLSMVTTDGNQSRVTSQIYPFVPGNRMRVDVSIIFSYLRGSNLRPECSQREKRQHHQTMNHQTW